MFHIRPMPALCRDCFHTFESGSRCPACRNPRVVAHPELYDLNIAHMDCDAFYASVEKRDNPALRDKPVIVGGSMRSVVAAACYIARIKGVKSAMPMHKALKLCPEAVVVRPRMEVYEEIHTRIVELMRGITPAVEAISIDEAYMDLSGTERLHRAPPAAMLARLIERMRVELGIPGSIGLSHNKLLAKIASDLDKPRGFAVIGRAETLDFLADKPVGILWGVGRKMTKHLERMGIDTVGQVRKWDPMVLKSRFGVVGVQLWHFAHGRDDRPVDPRIPPPKSIGHMKTFPRDTASRSVIDGYMWRLSEMVAHRAKAGGWAGRVVAMTLRKADFSYVTHRKSLRGATQMAHRIHRAARELFDQETLEGKYRLVGVTLSGIVPVNKADVMADLLEPEAVTRDGAERAADLIRARFGNKAIYKGRALR